LLCSNFIFKADEKMKKLLLALLCLFSPSLYCQETPCADRLAIEAKVGGFVPLEKKFRKIYSDVGAILGAESSYQITDRLQGFKAGPDKTRP